MSGWMNHKLELRLLGEISTTSDMQRVFPGGSDSQVSACNVGDRFDPWVWKMPWRRKWQPTPVAWKIPWTEEPGVLQSMGWQRVRHD